MVVPSSVGCSDEIAIFHGEGFTVDRGLGAAAANDETDRAHGVAMRFGDFARLDQLHAHGQRVSGAKFIRRMKTDEAARGLLKSQ